LVLGQPETAQIGTWFGAAGVKKGNALSNIP